MKIYFIIMILFNAGFFGARYVFASAIRTQLSPRMYLCFAVIIGAGITIHNALLVSLIAAVMVIATVKSRIEALTRLTLMVALVPSISYPMQAVGVYWGDLTTVAALSMGALIACLFRAESARRRSLSVEDVLVVVLMTIFSIAGSRAGNFTSISRDVVTIILGLGVAYFAYSRFVYSRAEFSYIVGSLAAASLILATIAIYEATFHWAVYDAVRSTQWSGFFMSRNTSIRAGFLRTPTSFQESTSFAVFQLVGTFAVIASRNLFRSRVLWAACLCLALMGLLAAQSRGADLGFLVGLIALMVARRQYTRAFGVMAASGMLVVLLLLSASSMPKVAAFLGADNSFGNDADYRQTLLRRGIQEGMKRPLLGDDMTKVTARLQDIKQGQGIVDFVNTPLVIFLSSGIVGLLAVICLTGAVVVRGAARQRDPSGRLSIHRVQAFFASALVAEWTALFFTSFWERNPFWLVLLIAGARVFRAAQNTSTVPQSLVRPPMDAATESASVPRVVNLSAA